MADQLLAQDKSAPQITFEVDDVESLPLTARTGSQLEEFQTRCGKRLIASTVDDTDKCLESGDSHPLVAAVHFAFAQHQPLLLTPDIVWITIAQGFAQHVNLFSETLRGRLVSHQGRETLSVGALSWSTVEDWKGIIEAWSQQIRKHVGRQMYNLLICDFGTTTPIARTVSQITMMNAFQKYFSYRMRGICGIPRITLRGSRGDWSEVRERVKKLAEFDLEWWVSRLLPICDEFVNAAEGKPNRVFWQGIYKPRESYGGDQITGWLAELFPYLKAGLSKKPTRRNPILSMPREKITVDDGISTDLIPNGLSQAPFTLKREGSPMHQKSKHPAPYQLVGGFIGVRRTAEGELYPELGWGVREGDAISQQLVSLASRHPFRGPVNWAEVQHYPELPADFVALAEIGNGGLLYADTGHHCGLRSVQAYEHAQLMNGEDSHYLTVFGDLADGRVLAYLFSSSFREDVLDSQVPEYRILVGPAELVKGDYEKGYGDSIHIPAAKSKIVAEGLSEFLERLENAEGRYYFDAPNFRPDCSLSEIS